MRSLLPPQVAPDEMQELHGRRPADPSGVPARQACRLVGELALVQIDGPRGARRGVRVVGDHDDRLAVLAVERLQQVQDLVARLAVEVAGRLVAQQQGRVGDDRAGDADALLLAAGELPRVVSARGCVSPTIASAVATCCLPLGLGQVRQQQRQLDVALGREHRQQVVELEHEADVPRAPRRQLAVRQLVDPLAGDAHRAPWSAGPARRSGSAACSCPSPTAPSARGTRPPAPSGAGP